LDYDSLTVERAKKRINRIILKIVGPVVDETKNRIKRESLLE
jgi:hypothetical protein